MNDPGTTRPCPHCKAQIPITVTRCVYCGSAVSASAHFQEEATRPCPHCKAQIPITATKCAYCGSVAGPGRPWTALSAVVVAVGGLAILIGLISYFSEPSETTTAAVARPQLSFTAMQLDALYRANEVAANAQIGNAIVTISGQVIQISQSDFGGAPYLLLATGQYYGELGELLATDPSMTVAELRQQAGTVYSMRADLNSDQADAAAALTVGDQVKVTCNAVSMPLDVDATGCSLVQ